MVTYSEDKKFAYFGGLRFCRDDKTGYYLNAKTHKYLHRAVYEKTNGPIPQGYHIHHVDHDKGNNNPENLELLTEHEHRMRHADEMSDETREKLRENMLSKANPAAALWHGSEQGREWHKAHYLEAKEKLHVEARFICEYCGKEYVSVINGNNRFCSNACRSAWRRAAWLDDEQRICVVCGKLFTVNHYAKKQTCSRSCANRVRAKTLGYKTTPVERKEMVK